MIHKVGLEIGGQVIQMRKYGHTVVEMIGGLKYYWADGNSSNRLQGISGGDSVFGITAGTGRLRIELGLSRPAAGQTQVDLYAWWTSNAKPATPTAHNVTAAGAPV